MFPSPPAPEPLEAALYYECAGPVVTALVPIDGSDGVSPDAVPYMVVDTSCGTGIVEVTLSQDGGGLHGIGVDVVLGGLYPLEGLELEANATYTLQATGAYAVFQTGDGPVLPLDGEPTVDVAGSTLSGKNATVSLEVVTAPDPFGAPFTLSRDGDLVRAGVDDQVLLDEFTASNHSDACYTLNQYLGDGSALSAGPACTTLERTGCATTPAAASWLSGFAGLVALLARRRPR